MGWKNISHYFIFREIKIQQIPSLQLPASGDSIMSSAADAEHAQDQLKPEAEQPKQEEAPSNKAGGKVIAEKVQGTVKWFNVRNGYGFISRNDNQQDVFVHQTSITKNNPKKYLGSVGDDEVVEFDVVDTVVMAPLVVALAEHQVQQKRGVTTNRMISLRRDPEEVDEEVDVVVVVAADTVETTVNVNAVSQVMTTHHKMTKSVIEIATMEETGHLEDSAKGRDAHHAALMMRIAETIAIGEMTGTAEMTEIEEMTVSVEMIDVVMIGEEVVDMIVKGVT